MSPLLRNRYGGWALVTGASSGIGRAYAEALAAEGFPVVLTARRRERLEEVARTLATETRVVPLDLARPEGAGELAAATADLDVGLLVLNAGFGYFGPYEGAKPDAYLDMIHVNCTAPALLARLFLPRLLPRPRSALLIVASVAAFQPIPYFALYTATKAFDLLLAESLYGELRPRGVDVLAVAPGVTRTEFGARAGSPALGPAAEPAAVVRGSLRALGRRPLYVHGAANRVSAALVRLLPRSWLPRLAGPVARRVARRADW